MMHGNKKSKDTRAVNKQKSALCDCHAEMGEHGFYVICRVHEWIES